MKILATAALVSIALAGPAAAQLSSGFSGSTAGGAAGSGTTSPSMPGAANGGTTRPADPLAGSSSPLGRATSPLGTSPLTGTPGTALGGTPVNPLGRTPSSIPSGVGAGLNQDSTASGLNSPGSSVTDAGRPAGTPLGSMDPAGPN